MNYTGCFLPDRQTLRGDGRHEDKHYSIGNQGAQTHSVGVTLVAPTPRFSLGRSSDSSTSHRALNTNGHDDIILSRFRNWLLDVEKLIPNFDQKDKIFG